MPPPRGGWEDIFAVIKRLFLGGLDVRAGIIGACVMPKFGWSAPFLEQRPAEARHYFVEGTDAHGMHLVVQGQILSLSRPAASQTRSCRASAERRCRLASI